MIVVQYMGTQIPLPKYDEELIERFGPGVLQWNTDSTRCLYAVNDGLDLKCRLPEFIWMQDFRERFMLYLKTRALRIETESCGEPL